MMKEIFMILDSEEKNADKNILNLAPSFTLYVVFHLIFILKRKNIKIRIRSDKIE